MEDKYAADPVTGPAAKAHSGPRSSPAVADGKVVTLGVAGVLSCLDAATGKLVWRKDPFPKAVPQFFTALSPIIVDGKAIVHLGGPAGGAIIAYDLATGDEKWKLAGGGPDYASPVLATVDGTKQIVTLSSRALVGVGVADGKLLWNVPFPTARMAYNAATPIVDGQTVIIAGAGRGTKAVKIEKTADGFAAKELWSNPDVAPQFASSVLHDGLLFGFSATWQPLLPRRQGRRQDGVDRHGQARPGFRGHGRRRLGDSGPARHLGADRLQARRQGVPAGGPDQGRRDADLCVPGDRRQQDPHPRPGRAETLYTIEP